MGTQGLRGRALFERQSGGDAVWPRVAGVALSFAILAFAAGCSSSSLPSFGSSAPQASAPPPPPTAYGQAPGQQAYVPPPRPGYPPQAQVGNPQPASYAPAAAPPAPPPSSSDGTVSSVTSSYTSFLKAFRDPDPDPSAARASVYPQQSLTDMFKGSTDSNQRPAAAGAGYPQQALVPAGGASPPQQNAYVPHPPSTYTPAGQPYTPPPGQSGYAPPPATPQNYVAPPPNPPRSGQQSRATPSTQQAARSNQQNSAPAPVASAPAPAVATAAPAATRDYSDSLPYPKQSLTDVFSGSTDTQAQSAPRPPSTYSASGQPAAPQGQAAPPANGDSSGAGPYPKQSLFEVFSSGK
jgi:hypothetical protein